MPSAEIIASSPTTFVDFYRIKIDVEKSKAADKVIEFVFNDKNNRKSVALHVRKGVVEYIPVSSKYLRKPDFTIEMDSKTWASIYLGTTDMSKAIQSKHIKLVKGDKAELISIFKMFDTFNPANNYKVPPIKG